MKKLIVIFVMLTLTATSFGELLCELNYQNGLIDEWDYFGPTATAEIGAGTPSGANWYINEGGTPSPVPDPFIWKTMEGPGGAGDVAAKMDGSRWTYWGLGLSNDNMLEGAIEMDIAPALPGGAPGSYQYLWTDDDGNVGNGIQGFSNIALNGSNLEVTLLANYGAVNDTFLTTSVASWAPGAWHNVRVEWDSTVIRLLVDDVAVAEDNAPSTYFAGPGAFEGVHGGGGFMFGHAAAAAVANSFQGGVDNVQVYNVIPEPATIALLGLGGLALLRKKRVS